MNSALPLILADRLDAGAPPSDRVSPQADRSGPSFADLLQRGQARHAAPVPAGQPTPSKPDAAPREDADGTQDAAGLAGRAPELRDKAARTAARTALRALAKAPAATHAAPASPPSPSNESDANGARPSRRTADADPGPTPPGSVPIADLREWMAALRAPESLPAQPAPTETQDFAPTPRGVVTLASLMRTEAPTPAPSPGPTSAARGLAPADGAVLPRPADDATALMPVDNAAAPTLAQSATEPAPAEGQAMRRPPAGMALLRPADAPNGQKAPDRAAVPITPYSAPLLQPMPFASSGPLARPITAEREDARRGTAGGGTAVSGSQPAAAAMPDPSAPVAGDRRPAPAVELPAVRDLVQGLLGGAAGAVPRGFDAGTLAPITLPAPIHSPEFAQLLGAQVSVLARDGVQQAEIHLNPAEMGPISVRISVDAGDARVDFHAEVAATREVIERGLPELASALREQGLTLAGGGVFQQAPDPRSLAQREENSAAGPSRRFVAPPTEGPARPRAIPQPQGRLDVYA